MADRNLVKSIPKKILEKLEARLQYEKERSDAYFSSTIEPDLKRRWQIYNADEAYYNTLFPRLSKKSKIVSYDVRNVVDWMMPHIMRSFFSSRSIVSISAESEEDFIRGVKTKKLIHYQATRKNPGFTIFRKAFEDAMAMNLGILKLVWERTYKREKITGIYSRDLVAELANDDSITILKVGEVDAEDLAEVTYEQKSLYQNYPKYENVICTRLRWSPEATSIGQEVPYIAQIRYVTVDHLRRQETNKIYVGIEKLVTEQAEAGALQFTPLEIEMNPELGNYKQNVEEAARLIELRECYLKTDIDGDGLLENVIVTTAGEKIIRIEENHEDRHPFFVLQAYTDTSKFWSDICLSEIIGQLQHMKVAINRQISVNLAMNNDPKVYVNASAVNQDDLLAERQHVRTNGNPRDAAYPQPVIPIAGWTMPYMEFIEGQIEQLSGRTRLSRGIAKGAKADTATGMQLLFDAGDAKLNYIIRNFADAEGGIVEMFRHQIALNNRYVDEAQAVRLLNEKFDVYPDDIKGEFDLVVDTAVGSGETEKRAQALQLYLTNIFPAGMQLKTVTPKNWVNATRELLELAGLENVSDYVPEVMEQNPQMPGVMPNGSSQLEPGQPGGPGAQAIPGDLGGEGGLDLSDMPPEMAGILGGGAPS